MKQNKNDSDNTNSGLESMMNKVRGFKKSIAVAMICLSAAAGYSVGHDSGYKESAAEQIYAEQKMRKNGVHYFERINEKYYLVEQKDGKAIVLNANAGWATNPYDQIKQTENGYVCKWSSSLGLGLMGVYVDSLDNNVEIMNTTSLTVFD